MHGSQTTSTTLTAQPPQTAQPAQVAQPVQPLFDFYPQITLIKQNHPNQDYSKTTLRLPQDLSKTTKAN